MNYSFIFVIFLLTLIALIALASVVYIYTEEHRRAVASEKKWLARAPWEWLDLSAADQIARPIHWPMCKWCKQVHESEEEDAWCSRNYVKGTNIKSYNRS